MRREPTGRAMDEMLDGLSFPGGDEPIESPLSDTRWPRLGLSMIMRALQLGGLGLAGVGGVAATVWNGPGVAVAFVAVVVIAAYQLHTRLVTRSLERLIDQLELTACNPTPELVEHLPLGRQDEIGHISRAMARVCRNSIRKGHEARQLRRTMDERVRLATRQATGKLHKQTLRDPLTDLGNRRFLDEQGTAVFEATAGSDTPLLCLALDLDHFKELNDTLGHAVGDDVLVFLGSLIKATLRDGDLAVRTGGDEFLILMPGAETERGVSWATQLRSLFTQQTTLLTRGGPRPDLSIGVAERKVDGTDDLAALMKLADERLYTAKRNGRGRTEAA
ncbi:MAG: GGDEF domain-containing protein [Phycisphaeraceae bacterium]